ncbi:hypothetical protein AB1Y20_021240 [Prymnesium parvum]|uniref:Uncharacterized protein n=1 Tax=Prymnesium parvum TaxID=97485 RepID=A0AB34JLF7_PRYPA
MRVLGLGWTEFATRWSSQGDSSVGTVAHLRDLLINTILPHEKNQERANQLPAEAQPPLSVPQSVKQLGTADLDAVDIEKKSLFDKDELERKVDIAMERRIRAGIADDVERMQPATAPPFNQELVGKRLEMA